jgi:hypothetical protein
MICSGVCGVTVTRSEYGTRQQRLRQCDLRQQVGLAHRVLGRGQQRHREQVDRIDVRGAVDVDLDLLRRCVDRVRQPIGTIVFIAAACRPTRAACSASMS